MLGNLHRIKTTDLGGHAAIVSGHSAGLANRSVITFCRRRLQRCENVLGHVGGFGDELVDSISKNGKRADRRNRHDQSAHGGNERLVNPFGQLRRAGRALGGRRRFETR